MISYHTCPLATLGGKDTGGMNVYVRELTRTLGKLGVGVDVFTRSQDEHVPHVLHDLGYGNRVVHIPAGPETPLPKQQLASYLPEFAQGIERFAAEKGIHYDLIHSHYWMSGIAAEDLAKTWKVPTVQMFHTLGEMKNRIARDDSEREGAYRLDGERQVMHSANRIVAATLAEQSQLEFLYQVDPRKIVVIPPGVDTARFYPIPIDEARAVIGVPDNRCMLLFVGRIEPLKGIDTLMRAIAMMNDPGVVSHCPHYLAIIGGDPETTPEKMSVEMTRLQALGKQLDIHDLVLFLGKQSQDSLPYYYNSADVLIMPSHYESFGMVALEAMACGKPVVASQVGGLAFLVRDGETGYVIPDGDPRLLAERLMLLTNQPELREQLGRRAAEVAQDYAWEKIAARIITLYEDVLKNFQAG